MKGYEFIKVIGNVSIKDKSVCVYRQTHGFGIRVQVEKGCKRVRGYAVLGFRGLSEYASWLSNFEEESGASVPERVVRILNYMRANG